MKTPALAALSVATCLAVNPAQAQRPRPGSSTVWLHMGAFGPKIVRLKDDGTNPPPPYTLRENQNTLLDQTDLVFLDPVGTGYSRATKPEYGANFWGLDEDVRSVGEFVR